MTYVFFAFSQVILGWCLSRPQYRDPLLAANVLVEGDDGTVYVPSLRHLQGRMDAAVEDGYDWPNRTEIVYSNEDHACTLQAVVSVLRMAGLKAVVRLFSKRSDSPMVAATHRPLLDYAVSYFQQDDVAPALLCYFPHGTAHHQVPGHSVALVGTEPSTSDDPAGATLLRFCSDKRQDQMLWRQPPVVVADMRWTLADLSHHPKFATMTLEGVIPENEMQAMKYITAIDV